MLRKCPNHGFDEDHQVCICYHGCDLEVKRLLDAAAGGSLLNKGHEAAIRVNEDMAMTSYEWLGERQVQIIKRVASTSEPDAMSLVVQQLAALNAKIEGMATHKAELTEPQPLIEDVNYVNQGVPRGFNNYRTQQGGGNNYSGYRTYPNLSYGNPHNAIQPPLGFSVSNGVTEESKKPSMDDLLRAFMGKTEKYMGDSSTRIDKLENTVSGMSTQMKMMETQIGQMAQALSNQHQPGQFPSQPTVNPKDCKAINLRSGTTYEGPEVPNEQPNMEEKKDELKKDKQPEISSPNSHEVKVPFPQRLQGKKLDEQFSKFLDIFRKVHINIRWWRHYNRCPIMPSS